MNQESERLTGTMTKKQTPTINHIVTYPNDVREDYKVWVTPEGWVSETWREHGVPHSSTDTAPAITPEQIAADVVMREIANRQRIMAAHHRKVEADMKTEGDALEAEWRMAHSEQSRLYR